MRLLPFGLVLALTAAAGSLAISGEPPAVASDADAGAPADAGPGDAAEAAADASPPAPAPPPPASAAPAPSGPSGLGFTVGLRGGYSIPLGRANAIALSDVAGGAVPIGVQLGYFLNRHAYVGGYFFYGFGLRSSSADSTCPDDGLTSCSISLYRFGAAFDWHFRPEESFDPWGGIGLGYEILNLVQADSTGATVASAALHGLDFLMLEGGVDFKPRRFWGFGPFAALSLGHYTSDTAPITQTHGWVTLGVRLRTGL
jgi:hypothetical protein